MLIDWFTVGAQVLNFLILVLLLRHFLYGPILAAIAAREKLIAGKISDATAKDAEATRQRDEYQKKNDAFDTERTALLKKATDAAHTESERLLDEARKAADALSSFYKSCKCRCFSPVQFSLSYTAGKYFFQFFIYYRTYLI